MIVFAKQKLRMSDQHEAYTVVNFNQSFTGVTLVTRSKVKHVRVQGSSESGLRAFRSEMAISGMGNLDPKPHKISAGMNSYATGLKMALCSQPDTETNGGHEIIETGSKLTVKQTTDTNQWSGSLDSERG